VGSGVHGSNAAAVSRQERDTNVISVLAQVLSEIRQCLRSITESVQEKNRLSVPGAQDDWTRAWNYVVDGN
jgi:hypothetical protein